MTTERIPMDPVEFRCMWDAGATCAAIAERFNCCRALVSARARKLGFLARMTPQGVLPVSAIVKAYELGSSMSTIRETLLAKFPRVSMHLIGTVLRSRGVKLRDKKYPRFDHALAIRLHNAGLNGAEIGRQPGVTRSGARKMLRGLFGPCRPGRFLDEIGRERMWKMVRQGMSNAAIARELGCTPQAVRYHKEKAKEKAQLQEQTA